MGFAPDFTYYSLDDLDSIVAFMSGGSIPSGGSGGGQAAAGDIAIDADRGFYCRYSGNEKSAAWFKISSSGSYDVTVSGNDISCSVYSTFRGQPGAIRSICTAPAKWSQGVKGTITHYLKISTQGKDPLPDFSILVVKHIDEYYVSDETALLWQSTSNDGPDNSVRPREKWFLRPDHIEALKEIVRNDQALSFMETFSDAASYLASEAFMVFYESAALPYMIACAAVTFLFSAFQPETASKIVERIEEVENSEDYEEGVIAYVYQDVFAAKHYEIYPWHGNYCSGPRGCIGRFVVPEIE